jgi:adenylate kinase
VTEPRERTTEASLNTSRPGEYHVVYLTGAPAAGKSTLSQSLKKRVQPLAVFEYGQQLTAHLARRVPTLAQTDLRAKSSRIATPEDIIAVDNSLIAFVANERKRAHVVIDSHAVTKETYGFRITPYSLERIAELQPTMIVMLYTAPDIALARIATTPAGRPRVTHWEAAFHTQLQGAIAVAYATRLGIPVYLLDADRPPETLVDHMADRLARAPRGGVAGFAGDVSAAGSSEAE